MIEITKKKLTGNILFQYSTITRADIAKLQARYEVLLGLLRPNAVGLVDAFDIRDEVMFCFVHLFVLVDKSAKFF